VNKQKNYVSCLQNLITYYLLHDSRERDVSFSYKSIFLKLKYSEYRESSKLSLVVGMGSYVKYVYHTILYFEMVDGKEGDVKSLCDWCSYTTPPAALSILIVAVCPLILAYLRGV